MLVSKVSERSYEEAVSFTCCHFTARLKIPQEEPLVDLKFVAESATIICLSDVLFGFEYSNSKFDLQSG